MYLSIYRSNRFELNSARSHFQYGTYLPFVSPIKQDLSPHLSRLWHAVSQDYEHDSLDPPHQAYADWRQIAVYDIGKRPLRVMGHSEFFNRFDVPNLADDIELKQHFRGILPKSVDNRRTGLIHHVRSMFCLNEDDTDALARRYLAPDDKGFIDDAQALMERVIDKKLQNLLTRLGYCVVPLTS